MQDGAMWFFKLIVFLAVAYIAIIAVIYAAQTRLLFPASLAGGGDPLLPPSATRLAVETPDGDRLAGVHIVPAQDVAQERPLSEEPHHSEGRLVLLGFGGNAWNAETLAVYLHGLYPDADIVTFHYRGYQPSTGTPGAAALLADSSLVYDHIVETLGTGRIVGVGFSIGTGVAAHLASKRPLAGLILVSPFESLEALASGHYPWAPVRWLLRHRMPAAQDLRGATMPIVLIGADRDTVVPPERTEAMRQALAVSGVAPVLDRTIAGAGHNDLYDRAQFRDAMHEALALINKAAD